MSDALTVLIIGGYGTFGGRLVRLLADEPRLTLLVAGRSQQKASGFCEAVSARARLVPLRFDRDGDVLAQLAAARPAIVVDATGPFQAFAKAPYAIVEACLALGLHYLDLADGSAFVHGIGAFDAEARRAGVFALSGASSFPVLTAAVVRELAVGLGRVDHVTGGVAPSPFAGVGLNVIRAIAGYAGQPVACVRGGRPAVAHASTETMRTTIAPPGCLPLRNTLFSLVDVPDLTLIPPLLPGTGEVWMGAGPVPEALHRALIGMAWLVRWRMLRSLAPFAPVFFRAVNALRWGEHRGGMFVEVRGSDARGSVTRSWHMLAEGGDGPLIPSMAIAMIVRRHLNGTGPPAGARSAIDALSLADYDAMFATRDIKTGRREHRPGDVHPSLYARLLGDAYGCLPAALRRLHDGNEERRAEGLATVERGTGLLARIVAAVSRFPKPGHDIPVSVRFAPRDDGGETWHRRFGSAWFSSDHSEGQGRFERLLVERFGPFAFGLALIVDAGRLHFVVRRWTCLGLPLPLPLAPASRSFETEHEGRFHFHVEIAHPALGLIIRYRGWLEPTAAGRISAGKTGPFRP